MFSYKAKFWLMLIVTVIMAFFCINDLISGQYLWAIVMGCFTAWNLDSLASLYRYVKIYYGGLF